MNKRYIVFHTVNITIRFHINVGYKIFNRIKATIDGWHIILKRRSSGHYFLASFYIVYNI